MSSVRRRSKTAVLLHKRREHVVEMRPDFVAFEIPDEFVVGYGLDYLDMYRNLPYLGRLGARRDRSDGGGSQAVKHRLRVLLIGRHFWPHGSIDSAGFLVSARLRVCIAMVFTLKC